MFIPRLGGQGPISLRCSSTVGPGHLCSPSTFECPASGAKYRASQFVQAITEITSPTQATPSTTPLCLSFAASGPGKTLRVSKKWQDAYSRHLRGQRRSSNSISKHVCTALRHSFAKQSAIRGAHYPCARTCHPTTQSPSVQPPVTPLLCLVGDPGPSTSTVTRTHLPHAHKRRHGHTAPQHETQPSQPSSGSTTQRFPTHGPSAGTGWSTPLFP